MGIAERKEIQHGIRLPSELRAPDWSRVPQRGHGVQFYQTSDQLLTLLTRYIGTAVVGGDVALVVATRAHLQGLERRLAARGLDVAVARQEGRYVACDARSVIDRFTRAGRVDVARARSEVRALLERVCAVRGDDGEPARVFAFGEMVAILTATSGPDEAIKLEEVWNDLAAEFGFTLCCAYPMTAFSPRHAAPFVRICGMHSHVFHARNHRG